MNKLWLSTILVTSSFCASLRGNPDEIIGAIKEGVLEEDVIHVNASWTEEQVEGLLSALENFVPTSEGYALALIFEKLLISEKIASKIKDLLGNVNWVDVIGLKGCSWEKGVIGILRDGISGGLVPIFAIYDSIISDDDAKALSQFWPGSMNLKTLDLYNDTISDEGIGMITEALTTGDRALQTLSLARTQMSEKGIMAVANLIENRVPSLEIRLTGCNIKGEYFKHLETAMNRTREKRFLPSSSAPRTIHCRIGDNPDVSPDKSLMLEEFDGCVGNSSSGFWENPKKNY